MANERFMDITPPTSSQPLPGAQVLPDQPPTWPGLATVPTPPPSLPPRRGLSLKTIVLIAGAVVVAGGTVAAILLRANRPTSTQAGDFKSVQLSLADLASNPGATGLIGASLQVNGRLNLSDSVVFNPSTQPTSPVAGQLYYDQTANQLAFYNGQGYLNLGATTNNTTNVTNVLTGGGAGVKLQATTPGTPQTGHLAITGTAIVGTLSTNIIDGGTAKPLFLNPVSVSTAPTPAGIPVHIGLDVPGATTEASPGWQDGMNAQKVTMGADGGKLQSMSVMYVGGAPTDHVQFAVYDDDGDVPSKPGSRLAASAIVSLVPDGWATATLPSITLSPNTTYWLAVNTDSTTARRTVNGGAQNYCYVFKPFGAMPDPFSAPGCFGGDLTYPLYATYTTLGGTAGAINQAQMTLDPASGVLIRNPIDNDTAFQIQNSLGSSTIFNVDVANGRVAIGKLNASYKLDISGGDANLSLSRSLRFGGQQTLTVTNTGITALTNLSGGGTVRVQGDSFSVQDRSATHANLTINNLTGATTFSNVSDSTGAFQVQNAGSTTVFNVDTTNAVVTVTTLVTGNITVNGHLITGGTAPGIAAGAAACTTPTVSLIGTDTAGSITITTGTGCAASGTLATITFAAAFGAAPHIVTTPGNAAALALGAYIDNATVSTTSFKIATGTTPSSTTSYQWNYLVAQ